MSIREKLLMKKIVKREKMKKELSQKKGNKNAQKQEPPKQNGNKPSKKPEKLSKKHVAKDEGTIKNVCA